MRYLTYLQYTDLTRENINLTSQAISLEQKPRNQTIHKTWQTLQTIFAIFLSLFLRKPAEPTRFT